ncbi:cytochrome-c peroxidase [Aliikangiella coralliicola]|uniref:C-type cytochrome n=1 Tax=Aliikangiella coralliicola TaxID=2592383 RepID=A0A545UDJ1_9GAMM|nr:cytochrome c peroxidase [Aliikangiella coralliicola]TQV87535.1 c-type cytochrome [Aliikangiella coralliicola]
MKKKILFLFALFPILSIAEPLGLPKLPVPSDNPQTPEKIALGDRLFNDIRFSSTGKVSCATCHAPDKAFTDSPLPVSVGINNLTGTRNAPTVLNAAYNQTQFWDGRSPDLEDQAQHPFLNPVEMGLATHQPILKVIAKDKKYQKAFRKVFGVSSKKITMEHVLKAIAAFERTQISGNSPFDHYYFSGKENALNAQEKRGFEVFLNEGRCVSCHTIEQDNALFTDHKFHNIGIGVNELGEKIEPLAKSFLVAKSKGADVDIAVLTQPNTSHLGRFAVNNQLSDLGGFKTPTLRNIALTAPYMHDGSLQTLRDVVVHYNNGGALDKNQPITPYLSGGIRPLNLSEQQIDDLVSFMESLTSPEIKNQTKTTNQEHGS